MDVREDAELRARVEQALEEVRPAIRRDGGDVWLVKVEPPVAYVQMAGACGGCSMVEGTLKEFIERSVSATCPEIDRVEQL